MCVYLVSSSIALHLVWSFCVFIFECCCCHSLWIYLLLNWPVRSRIPPDSGASISILATVPRCFTWVPRAEFRSYKDYFVSFTVFYLQWTENSSALHGLECSSEMSLVCHYSWYIREQLFPQPFSHQCYFTKISPSPLIVQYFWPGKPMENVCHLFTKGDFF